MSQEQTLSVTINLPTMAAIVAMLAENFSMPQPTFLAMIADIAGRLIATDNVRCPGKSFFLE